MFATLVVELPCRYTEGTLTISHQGEYKFFFAPYDFSPLDKCRTITFFADCEHEIKPLGTGHRITLIYNLMKHDGLDDIDSSLALLKDINTQRVMDKLAEFFSDCPNLILAYYLEHQYAVTAITPGKFRHQVTCPCQPPLLIQLA